MNRHIVLAALLAFSLIQAAYATTSPPLTDSEKTFVANATSTLQQQYPNTTAAKAAGYSPLEGTIDSDNTYDWTNFSFSGIVPGHPNFLWFDRHGNLAGADWELPKSDFPTTPQLAAFPVRAARWVTIPEHVHFAYALNGKTEYGVAKATPALRQSHITAAQLRASGAKLPADARLLWAMYHPAVWDLAMWLVPNPRGPFAEANPNVK